MIAFLFSFALSIDKPSSITLHNTNDTNSLYWRIPAIVRTLDGTIITACDRRGDSNADLWMPIQIAIRRSTDDGKTFSPTKLIAGNGTKYGYSDPSLVVDSKTGAVLCVFNAGNQFQSSSPSNRICQVYCISYDNGKTWSEPIDFTNQLYGEGCTDYIRKSWKGLFVTSGSGIQTKSGKIMFTIVVSKDGFSGYAVNTIWTLDLGRTWQISGGVATSGDETQLVQLNNNSILLSVRNSPRKFVVSDDDGETFNTPVLRTDIPDKGCNGGMIRYTSTLKGYDKDRIIHTNIVHSSSRRNLTIRISYDEGNTFKYHKILDEDLSAYSSLEIAGDGSILVFYEKEVSVTESARGYRMDLMRVSLEWLTDGEDKYTPPKTL